jgi:hypothetical protein
VPLPAAWSATGHAVAPVPFSFQRLSDAAALSASSISNDPEIHAADAATVTHDLVEHVRHAILNARSGLSRLVASPTVLTLEGMSDKWIRHFLNNLASSPGTRYLEVGLCVECCFSCSLALLLSFLVCLSGYWEFVWRDCSWLTRALLYVQVGSWRGSTFTSALVGNEPTIDLAVAVRVTPHFLVAVSRNLLH